jgi:BlaI family transcriptional regulator, penicillinase repressor
MLPGMQRKRLVTGGLEASVLGVLWDRGASTVAEIVAALPRAKSRHPNTIATVLSRMSARGLVARSDAGRAAVYVAVVSREEMGRRHLDVLREELFGGSLAHFVAALVRPGASKEKHRARLAKLLAEIEEEERSS